MRGRWLALSLLAVASAGALGGHGGPRPFAKRKEEATPERATTAAPSTTITVPPTAAEDCPLCHPNENIPYNADQLDLEDFPDTAVKGAGYVDCNRPQPCRGADVNYMLHAVERRFVVKGSRYVEPSRFSNSETGEKAAGSVLSILQILPWLSSNQTWLRSNRNPSREGALAQLLGVVEAQTRDYIAKTDVKFFTRTFEAMFGPNSEFCVYGGNGRGTLLGPCLMVKPGQTMNIFMKNDLHSNPFIHLKSVVPTKRGYAAKMRNLYLSQNNVFIRDIMGIGSAQMTKGKFWPNKLVHGDGENIPGWDTNKTWDVFNIHLHGMEVVPHVFDPMGTSDPNANWISIQPNDKYGQQCYCYRFHVADTQSKGVFLWHTHRHGTTSMATWGGMFGIVMTDHDTIFKAMRPQMFPTALVTPANNQSTSLLATLVGISRAEELEFADQDILFFCIWNTKWRFMGVSNEQMADDPFMFHQKKANIFNGGRVELNNFLPNQMPLTAMNPYLVNDEYQPTLQARAGAMTLFRIACVSTEWMCGFQIYEEATGKIVPFHVVSADGITWPKPVYYAAGETLPAELNQASLFEVSEAYLLMGGGNRNDVVVQFLEEGSYTVFQTSFGGQSSQLLAKVQVAAGRFCGTAKKPCEERDLTKHGLPGRPPIAAHRHIEFYRNITFAQELDRSKIPYVQWGVASRSQSSFQMYDVHNVNMVLKSGACTEWEICSRNPINHPFHIHVNPFQILSIKTAHFPGVLSCTGIVRDLLKKTAEEPLFRHQPGEWRDTAMVPPCGCLRIRQCYDAGAPVVGGGAVTPFEGKFVFHCHFLTHADTGLIHNVMIRRKTAPLSPSDPSMPSKYPGAVVQADNSACSYLDPCDARNRGCSQCPDHTWINKGCTCVQPVPGYVLNLNRQVTMQERFRSAPPAWLFSAAAVVGLCGTAVVFAALVLVQRIRAGRRQSYTGVVRELELQCCDA